jgi:hypothetical protein
MPPGFLCQIYPSGMKPVSALYPVTLTISDDWALLPEAQPLAGYRRRDNPILGTVPYRLQELRQEKLCEFSYRIYRYLRRFT